MGAATFNVRAKGKNAKEAFQTAREQAQYDYGHAGYTGTIAEKREFVMIPVVLAEDTTPEEYARVLIDNGDPRIDAKWGPAGCIVIQPAGRIVSENGEYLFFGWASC